MDCPNAAVVLFVSKYRATEELFRVSGSFVLLLVSNKVDPLVKHAHSNIQIG